MVVLLSTTYFGPVAWYQMLRKADTVYIEAHENYQKQTCRNRCTIGSEAGPLSLTVPVSEPATGDATMRDRRITAMRVSDHGNWRHLHWQALTTAYRDTPFFTYYADDLRPFFERRDWPTLWQLNEATREVVCRLLGIQPHIVYTQRYLTTAEAEADGILDLRNACSTKQSNLLNPQGDAPTPLAQQNNRNGDSATPLAQQKLPAEWTHLRPYWQPFLQRHGFIPGLSILDLLFSMGPEARLFIS